MKMLKRLIVCIVLLGNLCVFYSPINAQDTSRVYRKFLTLDIQQQLEDSLPSVVAARQQIEQFTDSVSSILTPQPVTLPIVFHIMNSQSGQPLVSEAQIQSQIEALNRDFNNEDYAIRHLADTREGFSSLVADMEISFCLADHAINGQSVSAVHYVNPLQGTWPADNTIKDPNAGGIAPWDPGHMVNVWVATLEEGISGFAQMPGGPSETDGIVIDYRFFGNQDSTNSPYNQGKTLTHLMGNYLNLYDMWGQQELCSDDKVDDTPIHNGPNYGCPTYMHVTSCGDHPVEMTMNFMDNTDDPCMYMFTHGQKLRVHTLFAPNGAREMLVANGTSECDTTEHFRLVDPASPIETAQLVNDLLIYPNPAKKTVQLGIRSKDHGQVYVKTISPLGTVIYQRNYPVVEGQQTYMIDCKNWASGIYYVQVVFQDEMQIRELVIH